MIITAAPQIKSAARPSSATHSPVRLPRPKNAIMKNELNSVTSIEGTSRDNRRVARSRNVTKATAANP